MDNVMFTGNEQKVRMNSRLFSNLNKITMTQEQIIEAFENLRYFESTNEAEWGRVQAEADQAIETLKEVRLFDKGYTKGWVDGFNSGKVSKT